MKVLEKFMIVIFLDSIEIIMVEMNYSIIVERVLFMDRLKVS